MKCFTVKFKTTDIRERERFAPKDDVFTKKRAKDRKEEKEEETKQDNQ